MLGGEIRTRNLVIANILSSDSMPVLTALYALFYFIPKIILEGRYYYFHFRDEGTEA